MKTKLWAVAAMVAAMILFAGMAIGQDKAAAPDANQFIEKVGDKGTINWTEGYVEAVGIGAPPLRYIGTPLARPNALRAAKVDAYRNLLELVNGVRVDSTTTIKDFAVESDIINTQVQGIVKGTQAMEPEYLSDGTVEVVVRMPLSGNFASVIIPRLMDKRLTQMPTPPAPVPAAPEAPAAAPAAPAAPASPPEVFTGLVVDARGIQARPAMSPRIIDESGQEVYGSMNVEREYAVQQGMSGYARDLTAAQSNARVTNNPLSVKGLKTEGAGRSDIVIANADAEKIRASADNLGFLKKCRVMIVLD